MKVLHISTADNAGAGLCCLRIHQSLLSIGVESKLVVLHNTQFVTEEYQYGFFKNRLSRIPSKLLRMAGLKITDRNKIIALNNQYHVSYTLPVSSVDLTKCEWVDWADIIHLHWVNDYLDYPSFFRGINKPVIWTLHDENLFFGIAHYSDAVLDHPLEKYYAQIKYEALSCVNKLNIVLLSAFFEEKFRFHKLLRDREVRVINNSVDTNAFKPIARNNARRKLNIADNDIIFSFTAGDINDERKGLKVLSQAIASIGNPKIKVLAIGTNKEGKEWPNVISVGMKKDPIAISEALSAADFFAMPSYQEAFAQSPMEAMACGLPIVTFPVSGTSELVNGSNGVICDDFTPEALRCGIEILMSRHYDSAAIRQDMINRFSPEVIVMKYVDVYRHILE